MRRTVVVLAPLASLAVFALACASPPLAQPGTMPGSIVPVTTVPPPPPTRGVYTLARGGDTIATEQFSRTANAVHAEFGARGTTLFRYDATLTPQAMITGMEVTTNVPGSPERSATVTFRGDTAVITSSPSDSAGPVKRAVPPGTLPYLNPSPSLMEQIVRRARAEGGNRVAIPLLIAGSGGETAPATVTFMPPDSARVELAGVAVMLRVDSAGAVLGGTVPAQGITITRSLTP